MSNLRSGVLSSRNLQNFWANGQRSNELASWRVSVEQIVRFPILPEELHHLKSDIFSVSAKPKLHLSSVAASGVISTYRILGNGLIPLSVPSSTRSEVIGQVYLSHQMHLESRSQMHGSLVKESRRWCSLRKPSGSLRRETLNTLGHGTWVFRPTNRIGCT